MRQVGEEEREAQASLSGGRHHHSTNVGLARFGEVNSLGSQGGHTYRDV